MTAPVLAWWFAPADRRLDHGDGRIIRKGRVQVHKGPLRLCESGLHASIDIMDALRYAPGPILCRVRCAGEIIYGADKLVCTRRTPVEVIDATDTLRRFARLCALDVIGQWDAPDVVVRYLKTGNESLRDAAWNAAWGAAWGAARDAARGAARLAAWGAARDAARDAVRDAVRDAARKKQRARLLRMVRAEIRRKS